MRLPDEVRESALAYAYKVFDQRRWEQVPAGERGAVYDELIADQMFGGPLRVYMPEAQIRVWLKDSVAKEYPRALEGVGSTAQFTPRRYPGPDAIAHAALGIDWEVVPDSIGQKPMTCHVRGPQEECVELFWGPLRGLRDLHWAASRARIRTERRVAIAITRPTMAPLPEDDWSNAKALCDLIDAELFSVMYAPHVDIS